MLVTGSTAAQHRKCCYVHFKESGCQEMPVATQENGSRVMSPNYLSPILHPFLLSPFFLLLYLGLDPVEILGQFQGIQGCIKITARKTWYCNSRPFCRTWLGRGPWWKLMSIPQQQQATHSQLRAASTMPAAFPCTQAHAAGSVSRYQCKYLPVTCQNPTGSFTGLGLYLLPQINLNVTSYHPNTSSFSLVSLFPHINLY